MTILVIAEHDGNGLSAVSRSVVTAAQAIGGEVHLLVAGSGVAAVASHAAQLAGVAKVLHADAPHYKEHLAENLAALIVPMASHYTHILAAASSTGKDTLPRAAALCDSQQISEITAVVSPDIFIRPIYAGNALETVQSKDAVKFITVRASAFDKVGDATTLAAIETVAAAEAFSGTRFVSREISASTRPELATARVVVSGGRGLGSKENFAIIERLADRLSAAVGASRAAVDAGYVPNDYQVGQTGKIVAPELYVAVAISGAIQHLAGMKDSKVIVAINKDENAPIFDVADYGLVGDLFQIIPELEAALS
jgi:electron transfer flavoprotein alpha subunit